MKPRIKMDDFGKKFPGRILVNDTGIELVSEYKYLGNIIRSTETTAQDLFSTKYPYLCDKANTATFLALQKLKNVQHPHPI